MLRLSLADDGGQSLHDLHDSLRVEAAASSGVDMRASERLSSPYEIIVFAHPTGLAIFTTTTADANLVPWSLVPDLLTDPTLTVFTMTFGDLSSWDSERLFCALAAHDAGALRLVTNSAWLPRSAVQTLPRHSKPWARFIDVEVLVGDLSAACCRAGLRLPGEDPLVNVRLIAQVLNSHRGQLAVRGRLQHEYPWLGESAWLSTTGQLAENVVLQGLRRNQVRRDIQPGSIAVQDLLGRERFGEVQRHDVRVVIDAVLASTASWNERGHLAVVGPAHEIFRVGNTHISLGVGGLHSTDVPGVIEGPLADLDVTSYYPSLIARDGISPPQVPDFSTRTAALLQRRLEAKRAGDLVASSALKYVINSLYGQLGNSRSGLFSPFDALRVVLTGQLHLLQLMDGILSAGGELISANTDGIVVRGDWADVATTWESRTGLTLERTPYQRLWRTSVNDYIATKPDGTLAKAKGRFGGGDEDDQERRSAAPIIARAVGELLLHQCPLARTIHSCEDISAFTLWRRANGLYWDGQEIVSSVVRWIVTKQGKALIQSTAHRESATVAAHALLVVDPANCSLADLNREWYLQGAQEVIDQVLGTHAGAKQLTLF